MVTARDAMPRIVGALQQDAMVRAVWIAGSVRDGTDDEVSDLDLWVEASDWIPDRLPGLLVAGTHTDIQGSPLLHGVTENGVIVDLRYGPDPPPEYQKLLAMSGEPFVEHAMDQADFRTDFWISSYKHRKPIWRGLDALVIFGLHFDRMSPIRSWVGEATEDPNCEISFSIHGLTAVVRDHLSPEKMEILGMPTRNRAELL